MKRAFFFAVAMAFALAPAQVNAQIVDYGGTATTGSHYLDFVSGSFVNGGYGVQVGPYVGNFVGDGFGQFSIYCVDYLHFAQDGNVVVSQMSGSLASTRLGQNLTQAQARAVYQKTAYLSSLFATTNQSAWGGIHAAIWEISSGQTLGNTASRDMYVNMANANYSSVNLNQWYVITAAGAGLDGHLQSGDGLGQEFLMRKAVPEPATILLMLTGFVMLVGVSRKRVVARMSL